MKVLKYGVVIVTESEVKIEGWQVEREASDPADATSEQLLIEIAVPHAQKKLNEAILAGLRQVQKMRRDAADQSLQN
jgi:hypothetical protein